MIIRVSPEYNDYYLVSEFHLVLLCRLHVHRLFRHFWFLQIIVDSVYMMVFWIEKSACIERTSSDNGEFTMLVDVCYPVINF